MNDSLQRLIDWIISLGFWRALIFLCILGSVVGSAVASSGRAAEVIAKHFFP